LVFGQNSSENGSDQQTLDLAFEMAVQNSAKSSYVKLFTV